MTRVDPSSIRVKIKILRIKELGEEIENIWYDAVNYIEEEILKVESLELFSHNEKVTVNISEFLKQVPLEHRKSFTDLLVLDFQYVNPTGEKWTECHIPPLGEDRIDDTVMVFKL